MSHIIVPGTGRLPDPADERDFAIRSVAPNTLARGRVERVLSLRDRLGPLLDQGETSECVTHGAAVVKTYQERKDHRRTYAFDPHRLYEECKKIDGIPHLEGTYTRTALEVMHKVGAGRVGKDFDQDAARFRISLYARLHSFEDIIRTITSIGPVLAGLDWFNEWFDPYQHRLATPATIPEQAYGHLVILCGYDLTNDNPSGEPEIEIRNSWGKWADEGHAFIPKSELVRQMNLPSYKSADIWSAVDIAH